MPVQQGGKAPSRLDFNGVLNLLSNILFYAQKGWQFEWDSSQSYYSGCIVKDISDGKMYMCINDVTSTTAPHSDTTNWKLWDLSMLANYLPLAGGTMKGAPIIDTDNNTGAILITGGPFNSFGTAIQLDAKDAGAVNGPRLSLIASSDEDTTQYQLQIYGRNGLLRYGSPPNSYNDLGGSAIVAKSISGNSNFIKFASGEIRQWGRATISTAGTRVTFPLSFPTQCTAVLIQPYDDATYSHSLVCYIANDIDKTGFSAKTNNYGATGMWMAVGF